MANTNSADFGTGSTKNLSKTSNLGIGHQNVTFSFWVKLNTEVASGQYGLMRLRTTTGAEVTWIISYQYNGGTRRLQFARSKPGVGGDPSVYYNISFGTSNWYLVGMTYDTATITAYVNGVSVGTLAESGGGSGSTNDFLIGYDATGYYYGLIDDFRVWDTVKTVSTSDYASPSELIGNEANLRAYYTFNSSLTTDLTSNAYTLTNNNTVTQSADIPFGQKLSNGVISYWKFDESSGNAADSVASNTLTNNNTATFTTGKISNSTSLVRASNQKFTITNASQSGLSITGSMSAQAWVKIGTAPTAGQNYTILGKADATFANAYAFVYTNSAGTFVLRSLLGNGVLVETSKTQTLTAGTWYHLVFVYTASTGIVETFVNGSSLGTNTGYSTAIGTNTDSFIIGNDVNGSANYDGMIDEVGIWNRILSSTEVTNLYNSGSGLGYPFSSSSNSFFLLNFI